MTSPLRKASFLVAAIGNFTSRTTKATSRVALLERAMEPVSLAGALPSKVSKEGAAELSRSSSSCPPSFPRLGMSERQYTIDSLMTTYIVPDFRNRNLETQDGVRCASYMPNSSRSTLQISPTVQRARSASRSGGSRFSVPRRRLAHRGERRLAPRPRPARRARAPSAPAGAARPPGRSAGARSAPARPPGSG